MNYVDNVHNVEPFILPQQNPFGQSVLFFNRVLFSICYFYWISLSFMFYCIEVSKYKLYNFYTLGYIEVCFMTEFISYFYKCYIAI